MSGWFQPFFVLSFYLNKNKFGHGVTFELHWVNSLALRIFKIIGFHVVDAFLAILSHGIVWDPWCVVLLFLANSVYMESLTWDMTYFVLFDALLINQITSMLSYPYFPNHCPFIAMNATSEVGLPSGTHWRNPWYVPLQWVGSDGNLQERTWIWKIDHLLIFIYSQWYLFHNACIFLLICFF